MSNEKKITKVVAKFGGKPLPLKYYFDGGPDGEVSGFSIPDEDFFWFSFPDKTILIVNDSRSGSHIWTNNYQKDLLITAIYQAIQG